MPKQQKNANYDFSDQREPKSRMGQGDFANLPPKAMVRGLGRAETLRDGLVNSYTCNITDISGISENER